MTLGQKLRYLRNKARLSQEEVAERLGISQSTYVRYEQDKIKRRKAEKFDLLIEMLGTTKEYLLGEDAFPVELRHMPDYLQQFVCDPEATPFLADAFIAYQKSKVYKDIGLPAESEVQHEQGS